MKKYKPTPQRLFCEDCRFGYLDGDFGDAITAIKRYSNLNILPVLWHVIGGDNPEFLSELFKYYHENVMSKLTSPREKLKAREAIQTKVLDALQRNDMVLLNQEIIVIITKEFPANNGRMEDFEVSSPYADSDTSDNISSDGERDAATSGSTNRIGDGDWHVLGAVH